MNDDPLFDMPENWKLPPVNIQQRLWARFPTTNGPIDIVLPVSLSVEEMVELVLPKVLKSVRDQAEWNEQVQKFYDKKKGFVGGDGI